MTKNKKWDQRVLANGNRQEWVTGSIWFGVSSMKTLVLVVGAWGRKANLLFTGRWKGSNASG